MDADEFIILAQVKIGLDDISTILERLFKSGQGVFWT